MINVRQRMYHHCYGLIALPETVVLENGSVENRLVDQSVSTLPSVESTLLEPLLKAGVNLQRVNCKLLASDDEITVEVKNIEKQETLNEGEN